jgi:hypothetical protein
VSACGLRPSVTSTDTAPQWFLNCQRYMSWTVAAVVTTEQTDRENNLMTAHQKWKRASKRRTYSYKTRRRNFTFVSLNALPNCCRNTGRAFKIRTPHEMYV